MNDSANHVLALELEKERLKLEREALAVAKERFAAERTYAEAQAKLSRAHRPASFFLALTLVVLFAFVGGVIAGFSYSEHQRDVRLRETLSQLDQLGSEENQTNVTLRTSSRLPLSVTVIQ